MQICQQIAPGWARSLEPADQNPSSALVRPPEGGPKTNGWNVGLRITNKYVIPRCRISTGKVGLASWSQDMVRYLKSNTNVHLLLLVIWATFFFPPRTAVGVFYFFLVCFFVHWWVSHVFYIMRYFKRDVHYFIRCVFSVSIGCISTISVVRLLIDGSATAEKIPIIPLNIPALSQMIPLVPVFFFFCLLQQLNWRGSEDTD